MEARLAKILLPLIVYLAVFAGGGLAMTIYEHRSPWGLEAKRAAAVKSAGAWKAASQGWEMNRNGWFTYAKKLETMRASANIEAAAQVSACSSSGDTLSHAAFENGYAAGKRVGGRQCGATHANPSPPAGQRPGAGGVSDPEPGADPIFGGGRAYVPASPVRPHG